MAIATYQGLGTITIGSNDSEIVFGSIPQGFRDLVAVFRGTTTPANGAGFIRFNGDSGNNYVNIITAGNTTPPYSGTSTKSAIDFALDFAVEAGVQNSTIVQIMDYSSSDRHKTALIRTNIGSNYVPAVIGGRWANNSAITTLSFTLNQNSYAAGSTFSLFGIAG